MKIGVITFWQSSDNYGQQLQCWALQQHLQKEGHNVFLIRYDFANRIIENGRKNKLKKSWAYQFLKFLVVKLKYFLSRHARERGFVRFRRENLVMSNVLYRTLDELKKILLYAMLILLVAIKYGLNYYHSKRMRCFI